MPIFEYLCPDCGAMSEILVFGENETVHCKTCGGTKLRKMISAHSSLSGGAGQGFPGPGDTACCGASPATAGCAGPGSCCGKMGH
jgi:putative FmdB family regulatory protein